MPGPHAIQFGPYELRRDSRELFKYGRKLKLRPQPFQVLTVLLDHPGEVVNRDLLHQRLWPADTFVDFEHGLNTAIKELRAVLDDSAAEPRYIETLPKLGYRFNFAVSNPEAVAIEPARPTEKPSESAPREATEVSLSHPASRKRLFPRFVVIAALLLGSVFGLWRVGLGRHSPSGAASAAIKPRPSIAVLGFKNLSHDQADDWMTTAISEMLGAELASGEQIRVIPGENISRMQHDLALAPTDTYGEETLGKIHDLLGTDMIVSGSFLALPEGAATKLRIVLQVQDTRTGETIAAITKDGTESELPELISESGGRLRRTLGVGTLSAAAAKEVRASVPANSDAERLYSEGLAKLRAFDPIGARTLFEQAIAADSTAAMPHAALAEAWSALGYDLNAQAEAKRAVELSAPLSREDKLSIEGRYRELTNDREGAVQIFRTLHDFSPDDLEYGLRLARAQTRANHAGDALETVAALRKLPVPQGSDPRIDLAESSAVEHLGDMKHAQQSAAAAIARARTLHSNLILASALNAESWTWRNLGEIDKSIDDELAARKIWLASGDAHAAAVALHALGDHHAVKGDYLVARKSLEEALVEFRRLGAQWDIASCSHNLGVMLTEQSELGPAKTHLEEALAIQRNLKDTRGMAADLDDLSNVLLSLGQLSKARQMKEEAIKDFREAGDQRSEAIALLNMGEVLYQQGDLAGANQLFEQSKAMKEKLGNKSGVAFALLDLARVQREQDQLAAALASARESQTVRGQTKEEVFSAESGVEIATITLEEGKPEEAESIAKPAAAMLEQHKIVGSAALAYSALARSLAATGKLDDARNAASRAASLGQQSGDHMIRLEAGLASEEVELQSGRAAEAARQVATLRQQAAREGYTSYEFEARLLQGQAQLGAGQANAARANLEQLKSDASAEGFLRIAHRCDDLLRR
ncbi:MAG TPA: tetratricopeptide repeat protein [Candidatus Acidoferrum sp.]|nr:tetratricopeptide repeat protein [Candidatus Acidoferrum sp.]